MKKLYLLFGLAFLGCSSPSSETGVKKESYPREAVEVQNPGIPNTAANAKFAAAQPTENKPEGSQEEFTSESSKIAHEFYQWYASAINGDATYEYQPKFVADNNGMLSVDYSKYIANLRRFRFSEKLIESEVKKYEECAKNLKGVKFSEKDKQLSDLEDYEKKGCDFFNYYRWIMDMETFDGSRIIEENIKGDSSFVKVQPYNFNKNTNKYFYWDKTAKVTLKKEEKGWEITNIEI
jgi:hypothetical protein